MTFRKFCLLTLAVGFTSGVMAQETVPAQPASAPVPATPAAPAEPATPASAATPVAAETVANKPADTAPDKVDADKIMAMQKAGYQLRDENGQQLFCKRDAQTGSRLRHRTSCLTFREWEQLKKDTELQLKAMERMPKKVEGR